MIIASSFLRPSLPAFNVASMQKARPGNVATMLIYVCLQCETYGIAALDALYTELLQPPTKVGIIGSGCSLATEPTAQVSHYYNVTHVR